MGNREALPLRFWQRSDVAQRIIERTQHERKRRSEFVADVGEEHCFRAVDFSQRLGTTTLFLINLGAGESGGNLASSQVDEICISGIVRAVRVQSRDEQA